MLGDLAHILADPRSTIPCIGASGGISGVLAFYALKFPNVRLKMLFRNLIGVRWLSMSARTAFFAWIAMQMFGTWAQVSGFGSVSALAHLGGASAGFACWMLYRNH